MWPYHNEFLMHFSEGFLFPQMELLYAKMILESLFTLILSHIFCQFTMPAQKALSTSMAGLRESRHLFLL